MEKKNKIIIGLGIALVLVIGILVGSSSHGSGSTSAGGGGGSSNVDPAPVLTDDELYLQTVRGQNNSYIDNATDTQLLKIGKQVCSILDSGYTVSDVVTYLAANGTSTDDSFYQMEGIVIASGVTVYCPEYIDQLP